MTTSPPPENTHRPGDAADGLGDRLAPATPSVSTSRSLVVVALVALALAAAVAPAAGQSDGSVELTTEAVASAEDQTISGTTTLDAGTELQVRVQSAGETDPQFLKTDSATVGPDGGWNATFDFDAVETHDAVAITIAAGDDRTSDFEVPIRNDQATPTDAGSGTSTPGFGVVVAVAALVGSAFLVRGRR